MKTITIRLNEEESKIFNEYAKLNNLPLSTLLKKALEEKINDEMDIEVIKEYEARIKNNKNEFHSHDEVKDILGL